MKFSKIACCLVSLAAFHNLSAATKPNVIVILTDDQGWADLGSQGAEKDLKTPHLDALAAAGVRLTSGYITSPQCAPSRAGIITGCHQQRYGIDTIPDVPMTTDAVTLAERLGPVGYRCGFVGKWHLEPNPTSVKWMEKTLPDFDRNSKTKPKIPAQQILRYSPAKQGFHEFFWGEMNQYRANYALDGSDLKSEGESLSMPKDFRIEVQTKAAVTFIERNHAKPFYLHIGYYGPHTPLEASKKYLDRFPGPMPERRRYALAMIAAIDDGVGEIMAKLREHGQEKNTLIVFTSDNGAPLKIKKVDSPIAGDPGGWDGSLNTPWVGEKGMLSEGGIRVPMIYSWTGTLPAGKVFAHPVSSLDIAATANALAGLPDTSSLDGVNLIPFLKGENNAPPHDALYWRFWTQAAIREGDWKYLSLGKDTEFLFNLTRDEHETKNLITSDPDRAAAMRKKLETWTQQFHPPGIPSGLINSQEKGWFSHYFSTH